MNLVPLSTNALPSLLRIHGGREPVSAPGFISKFGGLVVVVVVVIVVVVTIAKNN